MRKEHSASRRDFLTVSAGGIAALSIGGTGNLFEAKAGAFTPGMIINPAIDKKKVVYIKDMTMIDTAKPNTDFAKQNIAVNTARVKSNMDTMAKALTGKGSADEAWSTILQKPANKTWSNVKVFMKVNGTIETIMPHIAVVGKLCQELIKLGAQGSNITISDPGRGASGNLKYTPYTQAPKVGTEDGLPAGVKVSTERYSEMEGDTNPCTYRAGGKTPDVPITVNGKTWKVYCTKDLVVEDGKGGHTYGADMIINLAVNKGHVGKPQIGDVTLSMKNHVGTFAVVTRTPTGDCDKNNDCPGDAGFNGGTKGVDFFVGLNTSEPIMGSGPDYPVRQHLIIMDSLWASKKGPHIAPDCPPPGVLAMGTAPGVVDWAVYKNVRDPSVAAGGMGCAALVSEAVANLTKMCEAFGVKTGEVQWIDATKVGTRNSSPSEKTYAVSVMAGNGLLASASVVFKVSETDLHSAQVSVYDIAGKLVRTLGAVQGRPVLHWDGTSDAGSRVSAGRYVIRLVSGNRTYAKTVSL